MPCCHKVNGHPDSLRKVLESGRNCNKLVGHERGGVVVPLSWQAVRRQPPDRGKLLLESELSHCPGGMIEGKNLYG